MASGLSKVFATQVGHSQCLADLFPESLGSDVHKQHILHGGRNEFHKGVERLALVEIPWIPRSSSCTC
jgi:hypothetical protein